MSSFKDKEFEHGMLKEYWGKDHFVITTDRAGRHEIGVKAPERMLQGAGMRHYVEWYTKQTNHPDFKPNMLFEDKVYTMNRSFDLVIRAYPLRERDRQPGRNPYEYLWGVTEDAYERDEIEPKVKRQYLLESDCRLVSKKMLELLGLSVEEDEWGWDFIVPPELLISYEDD